MKLKKLLKCFDGIDYIIIWNKNNNIEVPDYKGPMFDIPKKFKKYKLAKKWEDGCLRLCTETNKQHDVTLPYLVAIVKK